LPPVETNTPFTECGALRDVEIYIHPHPALKQRAHDVDPSADPDVPRLIEAMAKAMYGAPGVGLAATQVGIQKRVFVFDLDEGLVAVCNPVLSGYSQETELDEEGCLSLPGLTVTVERPSSVVCEGLDLSGRPLRIEGEGLLARLLQHETDHLDGVLILDRATPDERRAAMKRYRELAEG
jgi:peptide deformylase